MFSPPLSSLSVHIGPVPTGFMQLNLSPHLLSRVTEDTPLPEVEEESPLFQTQLYPPLPIPKTLSEDRNYLRKKVVNRLFIQKP